MGNMFGAASEPATPPIDPYTDVYDESTFSKTEGKLLKEYFQSIYNDSLGVVEPEKMKENLPFTRIPGLSDIIVSDVKFQTLLDFSEFVGNCMRYGNTKGVDILWSALSKLNLKLPNDKKNEVAYFFIYLMYDLLMVGRCTDEDCHVFASRMLDHAKLKKSEAISISHPSTYTNSSSSSSSSSSTAVEITIDDLKSWMNDFAPSLAKGLEDATTISFLHQFAPTVKPFAVPSLRQPSSIISGTYDIMPLATYTKTLQGEWARLFCSVEDGRSFIQFCNSMMGYDGPTCIILKKGGDVFGAYCADKWKESNQFTGNSSDFLFTLSPNFRIYRSSHGSNRLYRWLNSKTYGMPHGIGFGGMQDFTKFRLFISDTFHEFVSYSNCLTFEAGKLVFAEPDPHQKTPFGSFTGEFDAIEVWGCGGENVDKSLAAREERRAAISANIERARKCDKAQFFKDDLSKELLFKETFAHRAEMEDREI